MTAKAERAIEVFAGAIPLPGEERAAFLDRACAGDEGLRQQIEALLKANDRVGTFLETPPTASAGEGSANAAPGEGPGDRVDRYILRQKIGEGGCGVVFVAEQEEPVRRRVALKIVKPGMDTKSVIARFEAERQALALMDHSNIAHVFDAGTTRRGRPYFVMELVDGVKITQYCDQLCLPTSARLELFVQVCDAIQHAHQKGIIHRDIKPSNVLVATGPDGKPAPKVIDFGIAKAIGGQQLTDITIFTSNEMLLGTPAYMSPEQAALVGDVDTRSDIYSLGVLLYEILTGTTPFDTHELLKEGFDAVRRVIRDLEPALPSTRLSTLIAADLAKVSKCHGAPAPKLIREMRGELDWIVMKALEKDRARRYATANGLAIEIKRYLSGEAVLARPPSAGYKFRKLVGRNKLVFSGVALLFALLVISLIATTGWLMLERGAREQLRRQTEIARVDEAGWDLFYQGRFAEAEDLLMKALALRRRLPKAELTTLILHHVIVVQALTAEEKYDKIRPFLDEFVDPALLTRPGYRPQFEAWARTLIEHNRWHDAAGLTERLRGAFPASSDYYHQLAPLLVADNDLQAYRLLCREIVDRFRHTTDVYEADRMAKDCLIHPSAGVDLKAVAAMADLAATEGKGAGAYPYFQCCKAMAQYRLGNYQEAADWAQGAANGPFPSVQAEAYAVLAMARSKQGSDEEARQALAICNGVMEANMPGPAESLGAGWLDWLIAQALQSEARQMMAGPSTPSPPR